MEKKIIFFQLLTNKIDKGFIISLKLAHFFSGCKGTTIRKASQGQFVEKYILFFISKCFCFFVICLFLQDI